MSNTITLNKYGITFENIEFRSCMYYTNGHQDSCIGGEISKIKPRLANFRCESKHKIISYN